MKYLLLALSFVAQSVFAQSYFKEGTKWKTSYDGYIQEGSEPTYMYEIVNQMDMKQLMGMRQ